MTARLTSSVFVNALIRRAESLGGFAAVLARGDAASGAILLILADRGKKSGILERCLQPDGNYAWTEVGGSQDDMQGLVERRRGFDPDLWVVELDIPSPERFAAEMNALN